jgi:DNA invertase Pin-like site-specific DNA recombinase
MLVVFAEFERDILCDRVKVGIAQAREEGRPTGGRSRYESTRPRLRRCSRAAFFAFTAQVRIAGILGGELNDRLR